MCGIQVCYSAQINLGTSQLLLLGISERAVSLAWLAGPLSGLIVQPIVGHFSDNCASKFGRRRPFLIAGMFLTAAALLLFSNSAELAEAFHLPAKAALPVAIFAFFMLDFSIQAIQGPLRALITDVVPRSQRTMANSYIALFSGLGNLFGSLLTAVNLSSFLPFETDVQALFACAALILIITVSICSFTTKETSLADAQYRSITPHVEYGSNGSSDTEVEPAGTNHNSDSFWQALYNVPRPYWRVFCVQLCTWCGFFTLFVYINAWVGKNVYLGDGTAPRGSESRMTFERGVRLGGKGNACMAVVTIFYALVLPKLVSKFGFVSMYAFSQVVEALSLMITPAIRGTAGQTEPSLLVKLATVCDIGMFGIVWATTLGVPWTLIGHTLEGDERYRGRVGLFQTIFNASQSGPQLIVGVVAPLILALSKDDASAVMFAGGVCAVIGAVVILILRVGDEHETSGTGKGEEVGQEGRGLQETVDMTYHDMEM